jgi:serine/threonine protein kinase
MVDIIKEILRYKDIKFRQLTKSESGFTNLVYFIDDKLVIKVLESNGNKVKFANEIGFYKSMDFDFIPKYICSGDYQGVKYLVIEKIQGMSLYEIWHLLSDKEKKNIIIQISHILKKINEHVNSSFLDKRYIRDDLVTLYQNAFDTNIAILEKKGYDIDFLKKYASERVPVVFKESRCGLVYNDAHFDNFIYDGNELKLIDFDRILHTSIDFELLILSTMVKNPKKFASERIEPFVSVKDYQDILPVMRREYPELFNFKYLDERLYLYSFFYTLGNIYTYKLDHLLKRVLDDFKKIMIQ